LHRARLSRSRRPDLPLRLRRLLRLGRLNGLLDTGFGFGPFLDGLFREPYFRLRSIRLFFRNELTGDLRLFDASPRHRLPPPDLSQPLPDHLGALPFSFLAGGDRLVLLDPLLDDLMRLPENWVVRESVPLLVALVVLDHRIVDHRGTMVTVGEGVLVEVADSHSMVIVHSVEVVPIDHHRMVDIAAAPVIEVGAVPMMHDDAVRSPAVMTVIGLEGGQQHPTDVKV
jgi:hypothetical protein